MSTSSSGTELYHTVPQSARIQKRLALNQCFRSAREECGRADALTYVTYGGEDMHDVMDFLSVFDVKDHRLAIISYEENADVAARSGKCPVASTLSQIETVTITVVPTQFGGETLPLHQTRGSNRFLFFLDDTRPFGSQQANSVQDILRSGLLRESDILLITSCITPIILQSTSYLNKYTDTFREYFGSKVQIDRDFTVRNHVDMFLSKVFSAHDKFADASDGQLTRLRPVMKRKFRYRDSKFVMGLWLYKIQRAALRSITLQDKPFEDFPVAFTHKPEQDEDIPNIFADL